MRHRKKYINIGRSKDHRTSLINTMVTQLFLYEKITTTQRKAQLIAPKAERILTNIKGYDAMTAIRYLKRFLKSELASKKVLEIYKARYESRNSGYTRMVKLGFRKGDNASMVLLELSE